VAWHGQFDGEGSLARVNRHLARALLAAGACDIIPCGEPSPRVEALLGLPARRREQIPADGAALVSLRHRWPPHVLAPSAGHAIHVQPWEYGAVPAAWIERLRARTDEVWCYTEHVRQTYVTSGMPPERTHVVPLGFDPLIYRPDVAPLPIDPPETCVFVFVGGLVPRKNLIATINAYLAAFRPGEPVALLIKDNPALGVYDDRANAQLRALTERRDIAPIRYIDAQYHDADMARLYRTAAAFVHSYRGEGFSLPVLEAMACGTPVIVTAGGAADDFVDERVGYRVPATREPLGRSVDGTALAAEGWWLAIDEQALAATLRAVFEHRADAAARGARAAARAHGGWTWAHAAARAQVRLTALTGAPPLERTETEAIGDYDRAGIGAPNGMDQILEELFARVRVNDPFYVDVAGAGPVRTGAVFGTQHAWRGLTIAAGAASDAASVAAELRTRSAPATIDLLVLRDGDATLWDALAPWRPRAVVTAAGDARDGALRAAGYTFLGTNAAGSDALFVRDEIVAPAGFAVPDQLRGIDPISHRAK